MGLSRAMVWQALVFGYLAAAMPLDLSAQNDAIDEKVSTGPLQDDRPTLAEQRLMFQNQELMTGKSGGWIFAPGKSPRIIWRDVDEVRQLGGDADFRVRWFNNQLDEFSEPSEPGRWGAWIE